MVLKSLNWSFGATLVSIIQFNHSIIYAEEMIL